jgi:hypothetical protein
MIDDLSSLISTLSGVKLLEWARAVEQARAEHLKQLSAKFPERIRRGRALPLGIKEELLSRQVYPYGRKIRVDEQELTLKYRKGRSRCLVRQDGCVWRAELFCWIFRGRHRAGAIKLIQWRVDPSASGWEFFDEMDEHSAEALETAEVILSLWDVSELAISGRILEASIVWMSPPHARGGLWAGVLDHLAKTHFGRKAALLVLKAFPLEYESRAPDGSPAAEGLAGRQAAMRRYYGRILGMLSVPGWAYKYGWMWRPLKLGVPFPRSRGSRIPPR